MSQNVYDNEEFFASYGRLRRSVEGLAGAPEWEATRALLPDLHGKRVLDLGCGYGWFCRRAREMGAAQVLGIDISERMLARATELTDDAGIVYARSDLEMLELPTGSFDFAYSSLALHYIEDLQGVAEALHRWLAAGAGVVFSIEHPVFMARSGIGWSRAGAGRPHWSLSGYFDEGPRTEEWLGRSVVKQHRSLSTTLNTLIRAGFRLAQVEEWQPTDAQIAERPELAEERERPSFLLVAATR